MTATAIRTEDVPKLTHGAGMTLARTDVERLIGELRALEDSDWSKPTDCDRWTVKDIVAHLTGMCEDLQSLPKTMSAQRAGKTTAKELGISNFDGWTESQVLRRRDQSPAEVLTAYEEAAPRLLRRREGANALVRQVRFPSPPWGMWSLAYLLDDILTRDTWMHRADIAKATGRPMNLTADHDGRFVANIVGELGRRRKEPFTLVLSGPAGGTYVHGEGGETFELDAADLCRVLSGRGDASHRLHNKVPF